MFNIDFKDRNTHVQVSTIKAPDFVDYLGQIYLITKQVITVQVPTGAVDSGGNPVTVGQQQVQIISMADGSMISIALTTDVIALQTKLTIGQRYYS